VPEWQLEPGIALRFDGKQSPNVKAGKNLHPYIYTLEDWQSAQKNFGQLSYWVMDRGMHPPDGFSNCLFTEPLLERCNVDELLTFDGETFTIAFLDPAFGGDACYLQFGIMGTVGGQMKVQLTDGLEVPIAVGNDAHDIDYQIARRVKEECKSRGIRPEHFGLDATAIGRGVGAILASEWSNSIQYMSWGGSASERPSAQNDNRPGKEVYTNFVTEMWFGAREAVESGQLKGLSLAAKVQFCSRLFEMSGKKYKLEPKDEMKERLGHSPDEADCVAGIIEVARRNGLDISGRIINTSSNDWMKRVKASQEESGLNVDDMVTVSNDGGWASEDAA
jgi:hypothetical protein